MVKINISIITQHAHNVSQFFSFKFKERVLLNRWASDSPRICALLLGRSETNRAPHAPLHVNIVFAIVQILNFPAIRLCDRLYYTHTHAAGPFSCFVLVSKSLGGVILLFIYCKYENVPFCNTAFVILFPFCLRRQTKNQRRDIWCICFSAMS